MPGAAAVDQPPAGLLVCLFAQLNDSFGSVLQVAVLLLEQPIITLDNGLLNLGDFAAGCSVECGRAGFQIPVVEGTNDEGLEKIAACMAP